MLALAALAFVACTTKEPRPAASPAESPAPSEPASASPTSDWDVVINDTWGYAVQTPPEWYEVRGGGAPLDRHFATEEVAEPGALSDEGTWLTLRVVLIGRPHCEQLDVGGEKIAGRSAITVDGVSTTRFVVDPRTKGAGSQTWHIIVNAFREGRCYHFDFISVDAAARATNASTADEILSRFRFEA